MLQKVGVLISFYFNYIYLDQCKNRSFAFYAECLFPLSTHHGFGITHQIDLAVAIFGSFG